MTSRPGLLQVCLSSAWGGLEMVAFETAIKAKALGVPVKTACLADSPLLHKLRDNGLDTVALKPKRKYFCFRTIGDFRRELKSGNYGSVLIQQLTDLWHVVPALAGLKNINLVGVSHTFVGISKKDLLHRWIYARVNHMIVLTETHKKNLLANLPLKPEKLTILPNTVDTGKFSPAKADRDLKKEFSPDPKNLFIGVVSRLDPEKGLLDVLSAAERLKAWKIPFSVAIFGDDTRGQKPSMKALLGEEIQKRGLGGLVHLAGHRSNIETAVAAFDVMVMPSPMETFGRVLIEAMASGVAVVACAGGGVPDVVESERTGLLVPPRAPEAIAEALRRLYENQNLREDLAAQGLERARTYYDQNVVDQKLFHLLGVDRLEAGRQ